MKDLFVNGLTLFSSHVPVSVLSYAHRGRNVGVPVVLNLEDEQVIVRQPSERLSAHQIVEQGVDREHRRADIKNSYAILQYTSKGLMRTHVIAMTSAVRGHLSRHFLKYMKVWMAVIPKSLRVL